VTSGHEDARLSDCDRKTAKIDAFRTGRGTSLALFALTAHQTIIYPSMHT
jgi:hypothetical protein